MSAVRDQLCLRFHLLVWKWSDGRLLNSNAAYERVRNIICRNPRMLSGVCVALKMSRKPNVSVMILDLLFRLPVDLLSEHLGTSFPLPPSYPASTSVSQRILLYSYVIRITFPIRNADTPFG